jgi:peptide/nickel transport system permease protein
MTRFLIRRIYLGAVVLVLITMMVFGIFFVAPNNVARTLAGRQATPETIALIQQRLGLDQPIWKQYLDFCWNALHGNLGFDYYHQVPVTTIITQALPATVSLAAGAAVIWLALGVFNGVVAAVHPRSFADRSLTGFALFFYSMPTFLLGLLLLFFLYFQLTLAGVALFPAGGYVPLLESPGEWFRHLVLPWLTLALVLAATPGARCSTSWARTTSGRRARRGSRRTASSTATGCAVPSRRSSRSSASTSVSSSAVSSSPRPCSASTDSARRLWTRSTSRTSR